MSARLPRFTQGDLDAMLEALNFRLAGEIEADTDADAERQRDACERASDKVAARLNAMAQAAHRRGRTLR